MPPVSASKKKKQKSILKNRVPNGSHRVATSVPPETQPLSTVAAPEIKSDMIHRPLNSSKTLSETQLNHLTNLNRSNALKREIKAAKAKDKSAEMKLNRQKRNHSMLGATSSENETKEETEKVATPKISNLISTDIPPEPTKTPPTSRQIPLIHSQTN